MIPDIPQIPTEPLTQADLPPDGADWEAVTTFCLSLDGYEGHTVDELIELGNRIDASADLSGFSIDELRLAAFIRQREGRAGDEFPPRRVMAQIRRITDQLRRRLPE